MDMIRLSVPGSLRYRDVVLRVVSSVCRLVRSDPAVQQEAGQRAQVANFEESLVSAVSEAFNNVALHAYAGRTAGTAELEAEIAHDTITIRLSDFGLPFDPAEQTSPDLDGLHESKMGLYLIRSCVDAFSYARGKPPRSPNVMTLRKSYFAAEKAGSG
ncbi:MAG TPA: ATP-binding protein [Polyangiaceae bacterium]|jgi:anti-sigma regulatory factor (Ser/Thr protein kinase)|nr:ATP-binding protein [Polyangiaceae bacterium]